MDQNRGFKASFKIKKVRVIMILSAILLSIIMLFLFCHARGMTTNVSYIVEDAVAKVPYLNAFVYGVDKPMAIDLTDWKEKVTADQLDSLPYGWPEDDLWFNHLNPYTLRKLKEYMKKNNLYIVTKKYLELHSAISIDDAIEMLEFEKLPEE